MLALFHNFSIFQDHDPVKIKKRKDPVGNYDCSPVTEIFVQVRNDLFFGFCINGAEAIIKNNECGVLDQFPGY